MTHGDQAKAKAAKSSQASATSKSSKTGGKISGKAGSKAGSRKESRQTGQSGKIPVKRQQAGPEKAVPAAGKKGSLPVKEASADTKGKGRSPAPADEAPGFTNPSVAAAFKRALKKYPNAFRKLTD